MDIYVFMYVYVICNETAWSNHKKNSSPADVSIAEVSGNKYLNIF